MTLLSISAAGDVWVTCWTAFLIRSQFEALTTNFRAWVGAWLLALIWPVTLPIAAMVANDRE